MVTSSVTIFSRMALLFFPQICRVLFAFREYNIMEAEQRTDECFLSSGAYNRELCIWTGIQEYVRPVDTLLSSWSGSIAILAYFSFHSFVLKKGPRFSPVRVVTTSKKRTIPGKKPGHRTANLVVPVAARRS